MSAPTLMYKRQALLGLIFILSLVWAQKPLEGIAATVGDELVLASQVAQQYAYARQSGYSDDGGSTVKS